jgi:hypothetical protein
MKQGLQTARELAENAKENREVRSEAIESERDSAWAPIEKIRKLNEANGS